jgi:hypothetical protein
VWEEIQQWLVFVSELKTEVLELQHIEPLLVCKELRSLFKEKTDDMLLLIVGFLCCFLGLSCSCLRMTQCFQQLSNAAILRIDLTIFVA